MAIAVYAHFEPHGRQRLLKQIDSVSYGNRIIALVKPMEF